MKRLLELHRFFFRESPRYILGDWLNYNPDAYRAYRRQLPRAYIRFMWYSLTK